MDHSKSRPFLGRRLENVFFLFFSRRHSFLWCFLLPESLGLLRRGSNCQRIGYCLVCNWGLVDLLHLNLNIFLPRLWDSFLMALLFLGLAHRATTDRLVIVYWFYCEPIKNVTWGQIYHFSLSGVPLAVVQCTKHLTFPFIVPPTVTIVAIVSLIVFECILFSPSEICLICRFRYFPTGRWSILHLLSLTLMSPVEIQSLGVIRRRASNSMNCPFCFLKDGVVIVGGYKSFFDVGYLVESRLREGDSFTIGTNHLYLLSNKIKGLWG